MQTPECAQGDGMSRADCPPRLPFLLSVALACFASHLIAQPALAQDTPPTEEKPAPAPEEGAPADDNTQAAVEAFQQAKALYKEGKYVEALAEFQRAESLKSTAGAWYNIAQCHEKLSQWSEAIAAYEKFMSLTEDPKERTEAVDRIEYLKGKLPLDQYQRRIAEGKKAYKAGDYEKAVGEFKAAYDMKPSGGPLYNIALSYEKLNAYEEAIDYFKQYLEMEPNAPDKEDVQERIRRLKLALKSRLSDLSVSSNPPGADVYVDDRNTGLVGQTNFTTKLAPGPHTIYLDLNGYEPVKREFVMPDDKPLALDFALEKLANSGLVTIDVNVTGARIYIDGAIIGLSPYSQEKALTAGPHQLTVEAVGYPRYNQNFQIQKDKTARLNVTLQKYDPPVSDDTLSSWGTNLILIGLIGGGLGFGGTFAYQQLALRRDLYSEVGPDNINWGAESGLSADEGVFYRGPGDPNNRENPELSLLESVQLWSIIGGSVFVAGGLAFYIYKWVRGEDEVQVITAANEVSDPSPISVTGFGVTPTPDGAAIAVSASF